MRLNITSALAAATLAAGLATGSGLLDGPDEILGTYDTPGGTLTVYTDHSAVWEPSDDVILGECERDDTNATTGEWHEPVWACAPMIAPDGAHVDIVFTDDGSASYRLAGGEDSPWHFDPEAHGFRR